MVPPRPWMAITGSPVPACSVEMWPPRVRTSSKRRRPGVSSPLVAARKPTPRWRLRRTCRRPAGTRPSRRGRPRRSRARSRVGGQRGVGIALGRGLEAGAAVEHGVVVLAVGDRQADPHGARPGVGDGRVVAPDKLGQHRDDAGLLRSGHLGHLPTIAQPKVTSIRSRLASRRAPNLPVAPRGRRRGPRGVGIGRCRRSLAVAVRRVAARPRGRVVGARAPGRPRARVHRGAGRDGVTLGTYLQSSALSALGSRLARGVAGQRRDARRVAWSRALGLARVDLARRPHRRARDDRRRRVRDRDDGARARAATTGSSRSCSTRACSWSCCSRRC